MDNKGQSLDDTLKDLLNQDSVEKGDSVESADKTAEDKPKKRGRRSKAEIEAEEAAKAAESKGSDESQESISKDESKQEDDSENNAPEVIPDTPEDAEENSEEGLIPEVIPDTPEDLKPDPEEPEGPKKKVDPGRVTQSAAEAEQAFKEGSENSTPSNSIIGQAEVVKEQTPLYRGPHVSLRSGHYKGLVTFISEITSGFVKVQYLRTGFGLCEGWMFIGDLALGRGDDEDDELEISEE